MKVSESALRVGKLVGKALVGFFTLLLAVIKIVKESKGIPTKDD